MKTRGYLVIILMLAFFFQMKAELPDFVRPGDTEQYQVRLKNGDILTGYILEMENDPEEGEGFRFQTYIGTALIFESQIEEIRLFKDSYRHKHRVFLLPTADPIGDDHFIGAFELAFFYAGFGIGDIVSITAGRSVVPTIPGEDQVSLMNLKATVYDYEFETMEGGVAIALGGNLAFINNDNRLIHSYAVSTFRGAKSRLTGAVFYKMGSRDIYTLRFNNEIVDMIYTDGSFGIALGLDTRISDRHGLHVIGELWNNDINSPTNTGIMLGLRLSNTNFAADFGMSFFTQPLVLPIASFSWTPF
ncbi:MAG: hypothetical protein ACLFR2_12345 [Candidatus Kapaibacterium sp.]